VIEKNSSRVQWNKSGELRSTIHKVVHVSLDSPESTFSGDYISAPMGWWPLKFLHALEIDQGLLVHTTNRVGSAPKNFKGEHLKLGSKFHTWRAYNFGGSGRNLMKRYQGMWMVITWTPIMEGVPPRKFGEVKNIQNSARFLTTVDFDCEYLRQGKDRHIENRKGSILDQLHFIPHWAKVIW